MNESELKEYAKDKDTFTGVYKKHDIYINRDAIDRRNFYIEVVHPSGEHAYDGWWNSEDMNTTIDDAIKEAIDGAQLDV